MAVTESDFGVPNPPVRFEQDPDSPEGTGMFHFQDGSSLFAHEPELARRVGEPRLAQNDGAGSKAAYWLDAPVAPPAAPESKLDAGGGLMASAGTGNAHGAPKGQLPGGYGNHAAGVVPNKPLSELLSSGQPAPAHARAPDPEGAALLHARLAQGAAPEAQTGPAPVKRPWVAGRQGGVVPTASSTTVESQGAPYSVEDAMLRERANQQVVGAQLAEFAAQKADAEAHAATMQAAIPELQYQAARGRSELAKLDAGYKEERARVRAIIDEHNKQAKPDPKRFFKNAGTLGTIGMVIAQALGAYSAAISHTDNFAQRLVSEAQDRDMRAQEEEIRLGQVSDNNLLAQLQDQLGDLDQAKSALRLVQGELVDKQIKEFEASAQSAAASRAAAIWLAQNQQQRVLEEQRFRDLSMGKQTTRTDSKIVTPTSGHYMTDEELMRKQLATNKLRGQLLESENEIGYQRQGGDQAGKIGKRQADEGPHIGQRGQGQIVAARNARGVAAELADSLGMKKDAHGEYQNPSALDAIWARVPLTDMHQQLNAAKLSFISEVGKAQVGGVLSEAAAAETREQIEHARTPGELGALLRHYDRLMGEVEQNVRDVAATSGRGGRDDYDGGGH